MKDSILAFCLAAAVVLAAFFAARHANLQDDVALLRRRVQALEAAWRKDHNFSVHAPVVPRHPDDLEE